MWINDDKSKSIIARIKCIYYVVNTYRYIEATNEASSLSTNKVLQNKMPSSGQYVLPRGEWKGNEIKPISDHFLLLNLNILSWALLPVGAMSIAPIVSWRCADFVS